MHVKLGFGSSPDTPQVFSERISRLIFDYNNWNNRDFDAKDKSGNAVEIKATGSSKGTTSINLKIINVNKSIFSHILWLYLDFERDQMNFKIIPISALAERLSKIDSTKDRENITLSELAISRKITLQIDIKNKSLIKI